MFKRFTAGFAVGYVFGAQAGQKRYEQITDLAQRAADTRVVAGLTERASEWWTPDTARNLVSRIGERIAPGGSGGSQATDDEEEEDEGPYDFDDEAEGEEEPEEEPDEEEPDEESDYGSGDAYDEEDQEAVDEEGAGDDEEDYEADAQDSGEEPASDGRRSRTHRPRPAKERSSRPRREHKGGIRSLAASARERGRVD